MTKNLREFLRAALAATVMAGFSNAGAADLDARYDFSIPAQPLAAALLSFSEQANIQVMTASADLSNVSSAGISGERSIREALGALLQNTGLKFYPVSDDAVVIERIKAGRAGSSPDAPLEALAAIRMAQVEEPAGGSAGQEQRREPDESSQQLQEIVVTAQKRAERLQDVPISMTVLGGEALAQSGYSSLNDALRDVPGVSMFESAQAGLSKISVRGVSSNPSSFNSTSTVGFYIDEIPFGFARLPFTPNLGSVYDLERVEVLRGPQGTLYGASSLNGVVRVLTERADPSRVEFKARGSVATTYTGGDVFNGDMSINVPLISDRLAIRATAGYRDAGGWIDRPADNSEDVNDERARYARLKLNATPTENLSVEMSGWFSRTERDAGLGARDDGTTAATADEPVENRFDAFGLVVNYEFPFATLTSASSYIEYFVSTDFDRSLFTRLTAELMSQEVRLVSTSDGPWRWSSGGIFRDENDTKNTFFSVITNLPPTLQGNQFETDKSRSYAIFGELSRSFFDDRFELTGGLRYFGDYARYREVSALSTTVSASQLASGSDRFHALTPRFVATFKPNATTNIYASYGEGFRSGFTQSAAALRLSASNPLPSAEPDRLSNYELGTKGSLFNGVLNYELAGYYIDWKDSVQVVGTAVLDNAGVVVGTVNAAVNAESVSGPGFDATLTIRPSRSFEFGGSFTWNDLGFDRDVRSATAIVYPKGSRPPESSEMTASGFFEYRFPLGGGFSGRLSGAVNYASAMTTAAVLNTAVQRGDDLLTAQARLMLLAPDDWTLSLFGENLTNEQGRIRPALPSNPLAGSDRLRPRTYGLQLDYRFN